MPEEQLELALGPRLVPVKKRRPPDVLFDAVTEACGIDPAELTRPARAALNQALKDLRAVDALAADVPIRALAFRALWPAITLTPNALAKHWPQLGHPANRNRHLASERQRQVQSAIHSALDAVYERPVRVVNVRSELL